VNATKIGKLLDEHFFEIGASGQLWSRSEALEALVQEDAGQASIEAAEMRARAVASALGLLTYLSTRASRRARRSSLWRLSDDS
jgi:hypothetical protein